MFKKLFIKLFKKQIKQYVIDYLNDPANKIMLINYINEFYDLPLQSEEEEEETLNDLYDSINKAITITINRW